LYARDFVIMNLQPLTSEQQHTIVVKQLQENQFFEHLMAFSKIRKDNDCIYRTLAFPEDSDRVYFENFKVPNRFRLQNGIGDYDPDMRQKTANGTRFVQLREGAPQSALLNKHAALLTQSRLDGLEKQILSLSPAAIEEQVQLFLSKEGFERESENAKLVTALCVLAGRLRQPSGTGGGSVTVGKLWEGIVAKTDEIILEAEQHMDVFRRIAEQLVQKVGLDLSDAFTLLPLRDPVSIHESALEDHTGRFSDGVLAEANIVNVVRARLVCDGSSKIRDVMELLIAGFEADVSGHRARLEMIRSKNCFASLNPTHARSIVNTFRLEYMGACQFVELQVYHRKVFNYGEKSRVQDHYHFFRAHLRNTSEGASGEELDSKLEARMNVFDEICQVPVLLSVMVCALGEQQEHFPGDRCELYEMGMRATLRRRFDNEEQATVAAKMLQVIATANHLAKRRTFQPEDVKKALKGRSELFALWQKLLDEGQIPLVKILTLGDMSGEFQFAHLSFQEAFFVRTLEEATTHSFWDGDDTLCGRLNEPFYRNAFVIGKGHLGKALAKQRPEWNFNCQPRLTDLGRAGLRNFLGGADSLIRLDLSNVKLSAPDDLMGLADAMGVLGLPTLMSLSLRWCQIPAQAAHAVGALLARCAHLTDLDLECNRELFSTPEAINLLVTSLGDVGLSVLERLSLRWCHIPKAAGPALGSFFVKCPRLAVVDLLGNRNLQPSDLGGANLEVLQLKGLSLCDG